jgi:hypothetical protein
MAKRMIDGIDVETSSGNVFADLDLADAEQLKIKSGLVIEITRAVRRDRWPVRSCRDSHTWPYHCRGRNRVRSRVNDNEQKAVTDAVQRLERIIMSPEWAQSKPNHHPCPSSCSHGSGSEKFTPPCAWRSTDWKSLPWRGCPGGTRT